MQRFSILIPTLNDVSMFESTLASVLRNRPPASEIIVVHTGEYDDPYGLGNEVRDIAVERSNLIVAFNAGVSESNGRFVTFLRPGIELEEGWHIPVEEAFEDPIVGMVSPVITGTRRERQMLAAGVDFKYGFRRTLVGHNRSVRAAERMTCPLGPTSWAGCYRTSALQHLGPVDEDLQQHYLDMELALCLSTLGFECELCPDFEVRLENSRTLISEMTQPHGLSAQRAIRRHVLHLGTIANKGRSIRALLGDLAASPMAPWRLKHALEKKKAARFAVRDEEYSDSLSVRARRMRFADAPDRIANLQRGENDHLQNVNRRAA